MSPEEERIQLQVSLAFWVHTQRALWIALSDHVHVLMTCRNMVHIGLARLFSVYSESRPDDAHAKENWQSIDIQ